MYQVQEQIDAMIGRVLESVTLSPDKGKITFAFADGHKAAFAVEGDCCSSSWIEHLEMPNDVKGATLTAVEDGATTDETENDALNPMQAPQWEGDNGYREHECLQVYHTAFRTTRGDIVLEYRNSSNGYYGGYLVLADAD